MGRLKHGAGRSPALPSWASELSEKLTPSEAEVVEAVRGGDWLPLATWAKAHAPKRGGAEILGELRRAVLNAAPDVNPADADKLALAFMVACSKWGYWARAVLTMRPERSGLIGREIELVADRRGVKVTSASWFVEAEGMTTLVWGRDFMILSPSSNTLTAKNDGCACWRGGA